VERKQMRDEFPDLWPETIGEADAVDVRKMLLKQVHYLLEKTKHSLSAEVYSRAANSDIVHTFNLQSKGVTDYVFALFSVTQTASTYPLVIYAEHLPVTERRVSADDFDGFEKWLRIVLGHPNTLRIVATIAAQGDQVT
jgi:hypothetical protein